MATKSTCDLCDNDAVDTVEAKSSTTTPIKLDVCEKHLAEFKRLMRVYAGRESPKMIDLLEKAIDNLLKDAD